VRWFTWRINATTELTAMIVSFGIAVYFQVAGRFGWMGGGLVDWKPLILDLPPPVLRALYHDNAASLYGFSS